MLYMFPSSHASNKISGSHLEKSCELAFWWTCVSQSETCFPECFFLPVFQSEKHLMHQEKIQTTPELELSSVSPDPIKILAVACSRAGGCLCTQPAAACPQEREASRSSPTFLILQEV